MRAIANTLNNDFFYLVKKWLIDVDENMKIKKNCKIEVKYFEGYSYLVYPLDCTLEEANNDIQWLKSAAGIAEEDNNLYIIKRINELLADAYEYNFDSMTKGNI